MKLIKLGMFFLFVVSFSLMVESLEDGVCESRLSSQKYASGILIYSASNIDTNSATLNFTAKLENKNNTLKVVEYEWFICRCDENTGNPTGICLEYYPFINYSGEGNYPTNCLGMGPANVTLGPYEKRNISVVVSQYNNLMCGMLQVDLHLRKVNNQPYSTLIGWNVVDLCANCSICGDGILDDGEECDDGNNVNGDGCAANCTIERECYIDDDCSYLNRTYCNGSIVAHDKGVCVDGKCDVQYIAEEDCTEKNGILNDCGRLQWGCSEELNDVHCVLINIWQDDTYCADYCDGDIKKEGRCLPVFFDCLYEEKDCNDYNTDYCYGDELKHDDYTCENVECVLDNTTSQDCSDDNACTSDSCDDNLDQCVFTPIQDCCYTNADCNDQDACTSDACVDNECVNGPIQDCCYTDEDCNSLNDDYCTGDIVKHDEGICTNNQCEANTTTIEDCDNDLWCDGDETCELAQCVGGTAPDCNDQDICTSDSCDEVNDECDNEVIPDCCVDNEDCNGLDRDYCGDNTIKHDEGICVDSYCISNTTETEDCSERDGITGDCGLLKWNCSEEINEVVCVITNVEPQEELCPDYCDSDNAYYGDCDDVTYLCEYTNEDCSVLDDDCNEGVCVTDPVACDTEPKPAGTDCGVCAACDDEGNCGYDETQDGDCSDTTCEDDCGLSPDNNLFTWDYADDVPNECLSKFTCSEYDCSYNHECSIEDCGAECESEQDCQPKCTQTSHKLYTAVECNDCECDYSSPQCVVGECGAECDANNDCACEQDYCDGTTLVDYPGYGRCGTAGEEGCLCQIDTGTGGDCEPTLTPDSPECGECDDDDDCNDLDQDYCDGDLIKHDEGKCINAFCEAETTTTENCDDSLWCNGDESCSNAQCVYGSAPDCSDDIDCTVDSCDEDHDECLNEPNDDYCGDGVDCTQDMCDPEVGCINTEDDSYCDNGLFCDGEETCDLYDDCQDGYVPDCSDQDICTNDYCDENADECVVEDIPDCCACDDDCDNDLFCDGREKCIDNQCVDGDEIDCSNYDLEPVCDCSWNPDGNPFTYDCAPGFTSECDEGTDSCTQEEQEFEHNCDIERCDADCEDDSDCEPNECEVTYDDYCDDGRLVEYDDDMIKDSTLIQDICYNDCLECVCDDCEVDCSEPETSDYCVIGECDATCETDDDCEANEICDQDSCDCECDPHDEVCDGIDNDCDGDIDEDENGDPLTQECGEGNCIGERECLLGGEWSDCSTEEEDCGVCCLCDEDGLEIYDEIQDEDCEPTTCPDSGCGEEGCSSEEFAYYEDEEVENECNDVHECTENECDVQCLDEDLFTDKLSFRSAGGDIVYIGPDAHFSYIDIDFSAWYSKEFFGTYLDGVNSLEVIAENDEDERIVLNARMDLLYLNVGCEEIYGEMSGRGTYWKEGEGRRTVYCVAEYYLDRINELVSIQGSCDGIDFRIENINSLEFV